MSGFEFAAAALAKHQSNERQAARQIELFLGDGERNRLIVALALLDPIAAYVELNPTEHLSITSQGAAIVESGLSLRHAHELKTGCSDRDLCAECRQATCDGGDDE